MINNRSRSVMETPQRRYLRCRLLTDCAATHDITSTRSAFYTRVAPRLRRRWWSLTAAQATAFFASDITLRLGIRGSAKLLHVGHFQFNVRFLSD
jgi:hypothetical protein